MEIFSWGIKDHRVNLFWGRFSPGLLNIVGSQGFASGILKRRLRVLVCPVPPTWKKSVLATVTRAIQIRINEVIANDVIYHHAFEFYFRYLIVVSSGAVNT